MGLKTPVVFIIFNRPDRARIVFERIAQVKPEKLLVIADGPRVEREGEAALCAESRALLDRADWPCEILTNFSETNLGLKRRIVSGLNWVFETVEEAIILEDDCVPHPDFFPFCEQMLEYYRHNPAIMHISGSSFLFDKIKVLDSYYFSRYPYVWGWATWRRAWQHYDSEMKLWANSPDKEALLTKFQNPRERAFWQQTWDKTASGEIQTWDYQWTLTCTIQNGLCIAPARNLVTNIGFDGSATNTQSSESLLADIPATSIGFPLRHPIEINRHHEADRLVAGMAFMVPPSPSAVVRLRRYMHKLRLWIFPPQNCSQE